MARCRLGDKEMNGGLFEATQPMYCLDEPEMTNFQHHDKFTGTNQMGSKYEGSFLKIIHEIGEVLQDTNR